MFNARVMFRLLGLMTVLSCVPAFAGTLPAAATAPASQQSARVVELSDPGKRGGPCMLDPDTGQTYGIEKYNDPAFIRTAGVDVLCETRQPAEGFVTYDLAIVRASGTFEEERSFSAVREQLAKVEAQTFEMVSLKGKLPAVYLFRTREGAQGVIELTKLREGAEGAPGGLDLRYRIIERPAQDVVARTFDQRIAQSDWEVQTLQATLGEKNPSYLVAVRRLEIMREMAKPPDKDKLGLAVADFEVQVKMMRLKYGEKHPVMRQMEKQLAELKRRREQPATTRAARMGSH